MAMPLTYFNNQDSLIEFVLVISTYGVRFVESNNKESINELRYTLVHEILSYYISLMQTAFGEMYLRHVLKNDNPRCTAEASVVAKRAQVRGDHAHTTYFATFQFESGDRLELNVPHNQFGYLVEGDKGKLTFQGTRFLEFQRM